MPAMQGLGQAGGWAEMTRAFPPAMFRAPCDAYAAELRRWACALAVLSARYERNPPHA